MRVRINCVSLALAATACATTGCATTGGAGTGAVRSMPLGTDDRVVVRSYADVLSVSASNRFVFALTTGGLITYDRTFARWQPVSARTEEALPLERVDRARAPVMVADALDDAVWIGTNGAVLLYRPQLEQALRFTVPGMVDAVRLARDGSDVYARASGQWSRVSRGGFVSPLSGGIGGIALRPIADLETVYQAHPSLRGQLEFLLRDQRQPNAGGGVFARVIAGTLSPDRAGEIWLGTLGDGLWNVDANFLQATPLRYGVLEEEIGALAITADGVLSAGQGLRRGAGISVVHRDLQVFRWLTSGTGAPLDGARASSMSLRGEKIWVTTDRGVVRVRDGQPLQFTQWDVLHGLPAIHTTSVVALDNGAWVGTARGLVFIHDSSRNAAVRGDIQRVAFAGEPVRALARVREELLVATDRGLFALSAATPGNSADRSNMRDVSSTTAATAASAASSTAASTASSTAASTASSPASSLVVRTRRLFGNDPAFVRPVPAVAWSDSLLLLVTDRRVHLVSLDRALQLAPSSDSGTATATAAPATQAIPTTQAIPATQATPATPPPPPHSDTLFTELDLRTIGPVHSAVLDARSAWIAGRHGVLTWSRLSGATRSLRAGIDVPDGVTAIALDDQWAWIGTNRGVVRVKRATDGGLP